MGHLVIFEYVPNRLLPGLPVDIPKGVAELKGIGDVGREMLGIRRIEGPSDLEDVARRLALKHI